MSIIRTLNYPCLLSIVSILAGAAPVAAYDVRNYYGDTGVWVQTLGGGGPELDDEQASASYLIWQDGKARVLIDPAPGSTNCGTKASTNRMTLGFVTFTRNPDRKARRAEIAGMRCRSAPTSDILGTVTEPLDAPTSTFGLLR